MDRIELFGAVRHKGSSIHPTCIVSAALRQGNGALGHWQAMLGEGMAAQSRTHNAALQEWEQTRPFPWLSCMVPYRRAPEHDQLLFTEEITVGGASRHAQSRRDAQSAAWTRQRRDARSAACCGLWENGGAFREAARKRADKKFKEAEEKLQKATRDSTSGKFSISAGHLLTLSKQVGGAPPHCCTLPCDQAALR